MNFLDKIDDLEEFKTMVKQELNQRSFNELDNLKREISNSFLTGEKDEFGGMAEH